MKGNDNLSFKVVQQKEKIPPSQNNTIKRNNLRKISVELKKIEDKNKESLDNPEKKNFFPKIENQSAKQGSNINNINNNNNIMDKTNNNTINKINNNIINDSNNITINNNTNNNIIIQNNNKNANNNNIQKNQNFQIKEK